MKGREEKERTLHPLGPLCRQRQHYDQVLPWRSCDCRSDCQLAVAKPTPSRRAAGRRRGEFVNIRDPIPYISLPESLLGRRRWAVDCALFRKLNECVYGLDFLDSFTCSGRFDVDAAASSGWAFTYQRFLQFFHLLKRSESLQVGEESFSKFMEKCTISWVSPRCRRPPRVHLYRSANRMSLCPRQLLIRLVWRISAETLLFLTGTVLCSARCSQKRITKNA